MSHEDRVPFTTSGSITKTIQILLESIRAALTSFLLGEAQVSAGGSKRETEVASAIVGVRAGKLSCPGTYI